VAVLKDRITFKLGFFIHRHRTHQVEKQNFSILQNAGQLAIERCNFLPPYFVTNKLYEKKLLKD